MKWKIIVIGKPALKFARDGADEYLKRLKHYTQAELVFAKDAERQGQAAASASLRIALDERGQNVSTQQVVSKIDAWEMDGEIKEIALLIGASDGHDETTRGAADELWAFGKLTLQHELALVVLLEQVYRAYTIKRGEPYHRD
ncbi:MAG: 23S rRNA (pseudouridine1915-N3)-methyltransferase [Verrucomicrobiales bacterium]|jgi:23S rRNA (pseudouridine1915-N3)-methyltransferase